MRTHPALALAIPLTLIIAGCVNAPDDVEAAATSDDITTNAPTDTPYAFEGSFGPMLWTCPMVTCTGVEPTGQRWSDLEIKGTLTSLTLTMTWDASGPHMENLRLGIAWGENGEEYESIDGTSPLVLELADLNITAADKPYVWTWVADSAPLGVAYASTPTDFTIEGELHTTEAIA